MRHVIDGMLGFAVGLTASLWAFGSWRHGLAGLIACILLVLAGKWMAVVEPKDD